MSKDIDSMDNELLKSLSKLNLSQKSKFKIKNGCFAKREYSTVHDDKDKSNLIVKELSPIIVSNCIFKFIYNILDGSNESRRLIYLKKYTGQEYWIELSTSELKTETFETRLKSKGCTWLGKALDLKLLFAELMDIESQVVQISRIGHQPEHDVYALSNCLITYTGKVLFPNELGIVKYKDTSYYIPTASKANFEDTDFNSAKKYEYVDTKIDFKKWSKLVFDASGVKGSIGIMYIILAVFWDIVFRYYEHFPFLFLFGGYGTGKTTYVRYFLKLFGRYLDGISLESSQAGINRTVSLISNGATYLKEYNSDTDKKHANLLLSFYDGIGRTTGATSNDLKTKEQIVKSALLLDGNVWPSENSAVFSRFITINFKQPNFNDKEISAFKELKTFPTFSNVLVEILSYRKIFELHFRETFLLIEDELSGIKLDNRLREHVSLILTPYKLLTNKLEFPFNWEQIKEQILQYTIAQSQMMVENKETTVFWKSIEQNQAFLRNEPAYSIEQDGFYLRFDTCYLFYVEYCKKTNTSSVNKSTMRTFLKDMDSIFKASGQKSRDGKTTMHHKLGSCYAFSYTKISESEIEISDIPLKITN